MSGTSNVGQGSVYEAGDQRPHPPKNADNMDEFAKKFAAGNTANIHNKDDPKDERSIANRLELESQRTDEDAPKTEEEAANKIDATLPARLHGNEPSKGAKIDQQIRDEEEEELRKKDEAKAQSAADKKH